MEIFGFSLNTRDLWLLALIGPCLAWLIPHRLAVARERNSRFISASVSFRSTFNEFVSKIQNERSTRQILKYVLDAGIAHDLAADEFQKCLGWLNQIRFKKAWEKYKATRHQYPYNSDKLKASIDVLLQFTA